MNHACFRLKSGETMYSFCKRNGLKKSTAWFKADAGMPPDDVVEWLIANKGKGRGLNNCKYILKNGKTVRSQCIENKICIRSCYNLIKNGYTPDEALSKLIKAKKEK